MAGIELHGGHWPLSNRSGRLDRCVPTLRRAALAPCRPHLDGFMVPEGRAARGHDLLAGRLWFKDREVTVPNGNLWQIRDQIPGLPEMLHGFGWLDDLSACHSAEAVAFGQSAVDGWIERYGAMHERPCWLPETAGRRLIRWCQNGVLMTILRHGDDLDRLGRVMVRHTEILSRRWRRAPAGIRRAEAFCGLVHAWRALGAEPTKVRWAPSALDRVAGSALAPGKGESVARNPEELARICLVLSWSASVLADIGVPPSARFNTLLDGTLEWLASLCHCDGSLPRMQGGESPPSNAISRLLAPFDRYRERDEGMGYVRLRHGDTSLVIDSAAPTTGRHSLNAHAGALAFEMVSDGEPIIVGRGAGRGRDPSVVLAARQTASHSTAEVGRQSCARFTASTARQRDVGAIIKRAPRVVVDRTAAEPGMFAARHDGYVGQFGVEHRRSLAIASDGQRLIGHDHLVAGAAKSRANRADRSAEPVSAMVRFHLHPTANVQPGRAGESIKIVFGSGQCWEFSFSGAASLRLEESDYLDETECCSRASWQIVLAMKLVPHSDNAVAWCLQRA